MSQEKQYTLLVYKCFFTLGNVIYMASLLRNKNCTVGLQINAKEVKEVINRETFFLRLFTKRSISDPSENSISVLNNQIKRCSSKSKCVRARSDNLFTWLSVNNQVTRLSQLGLDTRLTEKYIRTPESAQITIAYNESVPLFCFKKVMLF